MRASLISVAGGVLGLIALAAGAPRPSSVITEPPVLILDRMVDRRGAVEVCLHGTKPPGAALAWRLQVWRAGKLLGSSTFADQDRRAVYALCRVLPVMPAAPLDTVKLYVTSPVTPTSTTMELRPDGVPG